MWVSLRLCVENWVGPASPLRLRASHYAGTSRATPGQAGAPAVSPGASDVRSLGQDHASETSPPPTPHPPALGNPHLRPRPHPCPGPRPTFQRSLPTSTRPNAGKSLQTTRSLPRVEKSEIRNPKSEIFFTSGRRAQTRVNTFQYPRLLPRADNSEFLIPNSEFLPIYSLHEFNRLQGPSA